MRLRRVCVSLSFQRQGVRTVNRFSKDDTIWALKDVSFEVKKGEVWASSAATVPAKARCSRFFRVSRSQPTGRAEIHGRVGSLLEVGTGFHGELTGRENVYLNGAILGMKKAEIDRKFDEIVAFAEVEKFIDTPVKRYSSGMYVRLAFAVAAHLEPEILIIDEVLAVGDLNFQNKCLGKMGDVAREGRTVLFVSHNMGAVSNLCTTGIWMENGQVTFRGDIKFVSVRTLRAIKSTATPLPEIGRDKGPARLALPRLVCLTRWATTSTTFSMGETIVLEFDVEFYHHFPSVNFTFEINRTEMGMHVLHLQNDDCGFAMQQVSPGLHRFRVEIPNCLLYPTSYEIMLCAWTLGGPLDYVEAMLLRFSMVQSNVTKRTQPLAMHTQAIYYTPSVWTKLSVSSS